MWGLILVLVVLVPSLGTGLCSLTFFLRGFAGANSKEAPKWEWGTVDISGLKKRIGRLDQAGQ